MDSHQCVETTSKPCDTGSELDTLKRDKKFDAIDFSLVDPVFPDKTSSVGKKYFYTKQAILARGRECIEKLYHAPHKWVIVVSHSGFLRTGMVGRYFDNADYRVYDFMDPNLNDTADVSHGLKGVPGLKQWKSTLRGGSGNSDPKPFELGFGLPDSDEDGLEKQAEGMTGTK